MERDLNCLCGRVFSQTDDTTMKKIFWMLPCTMITLNAGQKSIFLRVFQNIGLQVCWIYMCMVCKRNLSLVHGMWSQLIEATLCVISINGTHLSQPHTWGLNPIAIAFYKQTSDYCQGFHQWDQLEIDTWYDIRNGTFIVLKSNIRPLKISWMQNCIICISHIDIRFMPLFKFWDAVMLTCSKFGQKSGNLRSHGVTCDLS